MNTCDIIVFDFETGGLDPEQGHEAIQVAGKAYDARTLKPHAPETGGEFCSLMKPLDFSKLQPKALEVNKKTVEMLQAAPDQGVVWKQFVAWTQKFNKGKGPWSAPIAAGKNIRRFDYKFVDMLNKAHYKGKSPTIFHPNRDIDLDDIMFLWFENEKEPAKYNMDLLRDWFSLSKDGAHDALVDVRQTGALIMEFLKLKRWLHSRKKSDGSKWLNFQNMIKENV